MEAILKRGRGRPRNGDKAEIIENLINTAERLMETLGSQQVTERTIAASAGVDQAMIHYYFGNMDGLMFALLDRSASRILDTYIDLQRHTTWHQANPTRHMVKMLIEAYYAKPWLARLACHEALQDQSSLRDSYMKRYGPQGLVHIRKLLDHLVECGVYDRNVDTAFVALSLFSIIIAPLLLTMLSGPLGIGLDDLRKDAWIDHVADQFDRQLRSASR